LRLRRELSGASTSFASPAALRPLYAPAAGRLAAAIATIWDSRRPIRDGAPRSNERSCCISHLPSAPVEQRSNGRTTENGLAPRISRDTGENSNERGVGVADGSGFIAAIEPEAE